MQIIRDQAIVEDQWLHVAEDEALPAAGDIIVPLARWYNERQALLAYPGRLGVRIKPDEAVEALAGDLEHFALIALEFPAFSDGRNMSQAKLLRERYAYQGEIRAVGDVLRDQMFFMQRCGINAFEVRTDRDLKDAMKSFSELSLAYQPALDADNRHWHPRHRHN